MNEIDTTPAFRFVTHWPQGTPKDGMAVLEFWRRENAIGDEAQAQQRLREVVLHAVDANDAVAAVCTAVPVTLPRLGQPMYYYRCFIGKAWRTTNLVSRMTVCARNSLERYAQEHDYPCIGLVVELESSLFRDKLRLPVWRRTGLVYIGKSGRGLDLRVYYFRGAHLKAPSA